MSQLNVWPWHLRYTLTFMPFIDLCISIKVWDFCLHLQLGGVNIYQSNENLVIVVSLSFVLRFRRTQQFNHKMAATHEQIDCKYTCTIVLNSQFLYMLRLIKYDTRGCYIIETYLQYHISCSVNLMYLSTLNSLY